MSKNMRIASPAELEALAVKWSKELQKRIQEEGALGSKGARRDVLVCTGGGCLASGALNIKAELLKHIKKHNIDRRVRVIETGCMGPCSASPVIAILPDGTLYRSVKPSDAEEIVRSHLVQGNVVERLAYRNEDGNASIPVMRDIDFFKKQTKIVLRNCGLIDPLSIEEYIGRRGYAALAKVLTSMSPENVINTIREAGLRGRGGAGFPTWLKWSLTRKAAGDEKFVLCNGDEGDPGAFMDRSVLEGDPQSVIEAMAIAAYAVGAARGFVYVRAEYPLAVKHLQAAIENARRRALLGPGILGSGFSFDLEIRMGSGAFVCGEETALMTSIEGNRGEPRPRPPFPANKGLWGKPSVLNNVETYAAVPSIILNGPAWYAGWGTERSKGTKVFALAGSVNSTGLVEVPIGTPLGEIIYGIGGGIPGGKSFKAAQIGGPSGGCIPKQHLDVPMDYESLTELGAIMGSGGLIVMDEESCMVDVARYFMDFVQDESCGKCVPCRVGTKRMLEILDRICKGQGEMADIERLEMLGNQIKDTALCGLGQTAPNPVLSTLRHFRDEYIAHIRDKRCPAGVCPELVRAPCQNACPAGVDVPGFVSLTGEKRYAEALRLHRERNPLVATCAFVCFNPCENRCRRATLDAPVSIKAIKRFMVEKERKPELPEIHRNPENAKRKIAVIGSGPSGLSCAYFLARLGYNPEIFEAERKPGGMLVQAIPAYRLPRAALESEINMIKRMGVSIKTGVRMGRDFSLSALRKQGFQAVFLGVGAPLGSRLGICGEGHPRVMDGISFLRACNIGTRPEAGRNVLIVGGGNVAIDVARTVLRLGADSATIVYRRTRDQMPAYDEEVEEAAKEGVKFVFLAAPDEITLDKSGALVGLRCLKMKLGSFDSSGRRRAEKAPDGAFVLEGDMVISAIGQTLRKDDFAKDAHLNLLKGSWLDADPVTGRTAAVEWVFAGGDAVTGPASVVEAIAAGEKAAVGIDMFLTKQNHAFWRVEKPCDTFFDPDANPVSYGRTPARLIPLGKRKHNFNAVELTPAQHEVMKEARRCLRCDYREPATK